MTQFQIFTDEEILNEGFRKKIIQEINGSENKARKKNQAAILEILRDGVRKFVLQRLKAQGFKGDTLAVMEQRAHSINLLKKIVSKKARSYSKGVNRSVESEDNGSLDEDKEGGPASEEVAPEDPATEDLETVAEMMGLTKAMKRADQYRKAAKNCLVYVYPELLEDAAQPGSMKYGLCTKVYFPHLYDAIPDGNDKEKMRCFILSPFATSQAGYNNLPAVGGGDGRNLVQYSNPIFTADGIEQTIANSPQDSGAQKREYVWWTAKYHFTTDTDGKIIAEKSPDGNANPINRLPAVAIAEEQDGEFWARGGDDLMESTILLNVKLTDMESILNMQGWGQLLITGSGIVKKDWTVGPHKALVLDTAAGAEHPTDAKILSHDPHVMDHLKSVELLVALLLTTNNLSVKSVATNLEVGSVASAIAKMVDESENMDDISEDQEYYACKEKELLTIAEAWLGTLRTTQTLLPDLAATAELNVAEMNTQFHNVEAVVTENEMLANLKLRKDLGIDSMVDIIKRANPQLSDAQAMEKLMGIVQERVKLQAIDPTYGVDATRATIQEQVGANGKLEDPNGASVSGTTPGTPPGTPPKGKPPAPGTPAAGAK